MAETYAPPTGAPPRQPHHADSLDASADDPPPAYTPSAGQQGDQHLAAGPAHLQLSRPPLDQHITGVGEGFGPRPQHTGNAWTESGNGFGANPFNDQAGSSGPPPRLPPRMGSTASMQPNQSQPGPSGSQDLSPTEAPTPGRPLLYHGQMLVYPKGHFCAKCGNTGYKANDPSNPHASDWRKYGKAYNSALATSYQNSTKPNTNPSTAASSNFQRPLPNYASAGPGPSYHANHPPPPPPPQQNPYGHLPPPPGKWNAYPGQHAPPPQMHPQHQQWVQPMPQQMNGGQPIQVVPVGGYGVTHGVPSNALVVHPGDPRIGGRLCWRCSGGGREYSFFGFDDGRCWECRGLGRLF